MSLCQAKNSTPQGGPRPPGHVCSALSRDFHLGVLGPIKYTARHVPLGRPRRHRRHLAVDRRKPQLCSGCPGWRRSSPGPPGMPRRAFRRVNPLRMRQYPEASIGQRPSRRASSIRSGSPLRFKSASQSLLLHYQFFYEMAFATPRRHPKAQATGVGRFDSVRLRGHLPSPARPGHA
jgi:hypothetical protein